MSLQPILAAILASGDIEALRIEADAQVQAETMLVAAQALAQRRSYATPEAEAQRAQIRQQAQQEARGIVTEARETLVNMALQHTRERLAGLRADDDVYALILAQFVKEALDALGNSLRPGEDPGLEADPRDRGLLEHILCVEGLRLPVIYTLTSWGGVIAKSADDRVIVMNTLESRLDRAMPHLRQHLAALFDSLADTPEESEPG